MILVAFLLSATLPFFAIYNTQALAAGAEKSSSEVASLFGKKIIICTANGFKWVNIADIQNGKEQPKPHQQYQCALCYVAAHGMKDAAPAQAVKIAYYENVYHISYTQTDSIILDQHFARGFRTRAPPSFA